MDSDSSQSVVFRRRGRGRNANVRKRQAHENSDSDSDDGVQRAKKPKDDAIVSASSASETAPADLGPTVFTADRSVAITNTNDATRQNETQPASVSAAESAAESAPGTYKGLANQTSFIAKDANAPDRGVGPIQAPTNIRTVTQIDYAPDVCKDYKKTGFCGFGDNCKYLHSREDYVAGWELDKKWDSAAKGKKNFSTPIEAREDCCSGESPDAMDEGPYSSGALQVDESPLLSEVMLSCMICREPYANPIVTRCNHYFCEECALKRYRRDHTCAACGAATLGIFNSARKLDTMLARKHDFVPASIGGVREGISMAGRLFVEPD